MSQRPVNLSQTEVDVFVVGFGYVCGYAVADLLMRLLPALHIVVFALVAFASIWTESNQATKQARELAARVRRALLADRRRAAVACLLLAVVCYSTLLSGMLDSVIKMVAVVLLGLHVGAALRPLSGWLHRLYAAAPTFCRVILVMNP